MALRFVAPEEIGRLRAAGGDAEASAALFADACRINVLGMIMQAGSGHVGTCFSCMDILAWLHLEVIGAGRSLLLVEGPRRAGALRGARRPRSARVRAAPAAAAPRRAARASRRRHGPAGPHQHRLARHGHLQGARVRPGRSPAGPHGKRVRADRGRRAAGGSVLGVAAADGEPRAQRDRGHRRPQQDPVRHLGASGERPRPPRGSRRGRGLGRGALRRPRPRRARVRPSPTCRSRPTGARSC